MVKLASGSLMNGTRFGRYEVLRRLAAGGMAQVCLARLSGSAGFEKRVVLKVLHPHMADSEQVVKMFIHEASIAAQLNHPNLVQILDLGCEDDQYFIAMEYIAGTNVRQLVKRAKKAGLPRIPLWSLIQIAIGTCDGLQYIHDYSGDGAAALNLVHRDVSPENIMLSFTGAVKLVDFGVLRIQGIHRTGMGEIVGKPHYMAPEQIKDQRIDRRADLFSLGVVLYECLVNRRPFDGEGPAAVLLSILGSEPTPLREIDPSIPPDLERIVMKTLARRADDRYVDASALREDLVAFARKQRIARDQRHLALLVASLFEDSTEVPPAIRRLLARTMPSGGTVGSDIHLIGADDYEESVALTPRGDLPSGLTASAVSQAVPSPSQETKAITPEEELRDEDWELATRDSSDARRAPPPARTESELVLELDAIEGEEVEIDDEYPDEPREGALSGVAEGTSQVKSAAPADAGAIDFGTYDASRDQQGGRTDLPPPPPATVPSVEPAAPHAALATEPPEPRPGASNRPAAATAEPETPASQAPPADEASGAPSKFGAEAGTAAFGAPDSAPSSFGSASSIRSVAAVFEAAERVKMEGGEDLGSGAGSRSVFGTGATLVGARKELASVFTASNRNEAERNSSFELFQARKGVPAGKAVFGAGESPPPKEPPPREPPREKGLFERPAERTFDREERTSSGGLFRPSAPARPAPAVGTRPTGAKPSKTSAPTEDVWTRRPAVESNQPRHAALFEEGLQHAAAGEYALALEKWEQACKLDPANRSYSANLKKLRDKLGSNRR